MPPRLRSASNYSRLAYVDIQFNEIIVRGNERAITAINKIISENPDLTIYVNAKLVKSDRRPDIHAQLTLPVTGFAVHEGLSDLGGGRQSE